MKKLLQAIGNIFASLFNGASRTWRKLSPEVQDALKLGSGVVATINDTLDGTPDFILELILKKFPQFDRDKLKDILKDAADTLNIASDVNDPDLLTLIKNIQQALQKAEGRTWAVISDGLAKAIALFAAPPGTKLAAIAFQFLYGAIKRKGCCLPTALASAFQFLYGAIKRVCDNIHQAYPYAFSIPLWCD